MRLPFSLWMTEQTAPVPDEYLAANPDLSGATPLQVYDACVEALTDAGLIVIPNCHTLDAGWCCSEHRRERPVVQPALAGRAYLAAWRDMAVRYRSNPMVAGLGIMNEPRRARVGGRVLTPTWVSGPKTDIAAMYTAAGNLIHEVSPDVLIICEGLGFAADLTGVARHPVRLRAPGQGRVQPARLPVVPPRRAAEGGVPRPDAPGRRIHPHRNRPAVDRRVRQRHQVAGQFRPRGVTSVRVVEQRRGLDHRA